MNHEELIARIKEADPDDHGLRSSISLGIRASKLKLEDLGELPPGFLESLGNLELFSEEMLALLQKIVDMGTKRLAYDSEVVFSALEHTEFIYPCLGVLFAKGVYFTQKNSKGVSFRDIIHDKHKSTFDFMKMASLIE